MANAFREEDESLRENYLMAFQENNSVGPFNYTTEGAFLIMKLPLIVRKGLCNYISLLF